jgi:hypothetical protein
VRHERGSVTDKTELAKFTGGMDVTTRISGHVRWRGHGTVAVSGEGIEFALNGGFRWMGHKYVKRDDLAYVYPVRARPLSVTSIVASIVPNLSNTAVRFVTKPAGMSNDRDNCIFYSYRHEEWKLVDLLEEQGYPVDRKLKTLRLRWEDEA